MRVRSRIRLTALRASATPSSSRVVPPASWLQSIKPLRGCVGSSPPPGHPGPHLRLQLQLPGEAQAEVQEAEASRDGGRVGAQAGGGAQGGTQDECQGLQYMYIAVQWLKQSTGCSEGQGWVAHEVA